MKLHGFRQDNRINRIFLYPVDPVRKINRPFDKKAHDRQNTLLRHLSAGGGFDTCPEEDSLFDIRFFMGFVTS
jgi:hypothetical protein